MALTHISGGKPARLAKIWPCRGRLSITDNPAEFLRRRHTTRPARRETPDKMPAPTALVRKPQEAIEDVAMEAVNVPLPAEDDADLIDMSLEPASTITDTPAAQAEDTPMVDETGRPKFAPATSIPLAFRREQRKVPVPPHRMTPLKAVWPKIYVRVPYSPAERTK